MKIKLMSLFEKKKSKQIFFQTSLNKIIQHLQKIFSCGENLQSPQTLPVRVSPIWATMQVYHFALFYIIAYEKF